MDQAHKADDTLVIRSAEPADAAATSALLGETGTFEGTLQLPDMPVASRLEMLQRVDPLACRLVAVTAGEVVGTAGLHVQHAGLRRSHVRGLGIAIAPAWQGRGLGRQLITRLLDWADKWAGLQRIELWVHVDNERAITLYRSLGFVQEGRHAGYALKNGRYVDSLSMARLHPDPPPRIR
ncbi:MAG: GNAT family N-acetyltransferase [Ramlibacter sp.]